MIRWVPDSQKQEELYEGDSERNSLIPHRSDDQRTMSGNQLIKKGESYGG